MLQLIKIKFDILLEQFRLNILLCNESYSIKGNTAVILIVFGEKTHKQIKLQKTLVFKRVWTFKNGMMIISTEHIFIPVWMTLIFSYGQGPE